MDQVVSSGASSCRRSSVSAIEESSTVEEQLANGDDLLRCFSPLFNSLRVFGLYFTRALRRIFDETARSATGSADSKIHSKWNGGRIYAVVSLTVVWLNMARMLTMFEKTDKFGVLLFMKLSTISAAIFCSLQQTAFFVSCQTGNLDRVFREARLTKSDMARYRRLAIIHTIVCWFLLVLNTNAVLLPDLLIGSEFNPSLTVFGVHVTSSGLVVLLAKVTASLLFIMGEFTWFLSYSVNYICFCNNFNNPRAIPVFVKIC